MTLSHWHLAHEFLPEIVKRNHGHIVSVVSASAYMPLPQLGGYAAAKAAALSFNETLHGELRARYHAPKVRTTTVCPTKVNTALGANMDGQANQFLTPDLEPVQVGQAIVDAIDSGLSQQVILPALMNILPFTSRGPAWFKRIIELVCVLTGPAASQVVLTLRFPADWRHRPEHQRRRLAALPQGGLPDDLLITAASPAVSASMRSIRGGASLDVPHS